MLAWLLSQREGHRLVHDYFCLLRLHLLFFLTIVAVLQLVKILIDKHRLVLRNQDLQDRSTNGHRVVLFTEFVAGVAEILWDEVHGC